MISFDYPVGWKISALGSSARFAHKCTIKIIRNHEWFRPLETAGWNQIEINFINNKERIENETKYPSHLDKLRKAQNFPAFLHAHEYNAGQLPPVQTEFDSYLGKPMGTILLLTANTTGYVYQGIWTGASPIDGTRINGISSDQKFNMVYKDMAVIFHKDTDWFYEAIYRGPGMEFDQYRPAFQRLLVSMRLTPTTATTCGTSNEDSAVEPSGGVLMGTKSSVPLLR